MRDIMLDVETTGTNPDRHAVIQIAAVRFDLETGEVDGANMFNQCLDIPPWRSWDQDTAEWWNTKSAVLRSIYARMRPHREVLAELVEWAGYDSPVMWAKPITFYYMFVASALKDAGQHNPFSYREAMDIRSYLRGLAGGTHYIQEKELEFQGPAHDAIFDVLHQIKWLLANQKKYGRQTTLIENPAQPSLVSA